jgi:hypothetical protein
MGCIAMDILMISDNEDRGGAAIAASRLAIAFAGEGMEGTLTVRARSKVT